MWYKFWVRSSRGTNDWAYFWLTAKDLKELPLADRVEKWIETNFPGPLAVSENIVSGGHRKVKLGTDSQILKKIQNLNTQRFQLEREVHKLDKEVRRLADARNHR